MEDQIKRLEAVCSRLERVAFKAGAGEDADPESLPEGFLEMQTVFNTEGKAFMDLWAGIDGGKYKGVEVPVERVMQSCMDSVLKLLATTNKCKKPSDDVLMAAMQPLQDAIKESGNIAMTRNKKWRPYDDYHVVLKEFCTGFLWVFHRPPSLPKPYWESQMDAMLTAMQSKCWKKKKDEHKDHLRSWMNAGKAFGAAVTEVIKTHYKVGVEWYGQEDFAMGDVKAAPAAAAGAKEEEVEPKKEEKNATEKQADIGAALSKGLAVTGGLKKVKKEQRNKYSGEKISGKVSAGPTKAKIKKKKTAKRSKRGHTWFFENYQNYQGDGRVTIDNAEEYDMKKSLYICGSINSDFLVNVKVKTITLDSCKRTRVQIDSDIISSIELVNCANCTIYVNGVSPSVTMDKCDSPKIIMSAKAWPAEGAKPNVLYSSCSAANIILTEGESQNTYALPEQFEFKGGKNGRAEVGILVHSD